MNRRRFLRNALGSTAALAFAPGLLRAEVAYSTDAARFADGLARQPWLAGWKTVGSESLGPTAATLEGRLPKALAGALYRNGPAWFDRDGFRYKHWFDGDGMVHAWRIKRGGVEHRARMVATPKFTREQREARFLMPAAGTTVPSKYPPAKPGALSDCWPLKGAFSQSQKQDQEHLRWGEADCRKGRTL